MDIESKKNLIKKIMEKPELKDIPIEDVEMALSLCAKKNNSDEENIENTRKLLHDVYGAFGSRKLLVNSSKRGQIKEETEEFGRVGLI